MPHHKIIQLYKKYYRLLYRNLLLKIFQLLNYQYLLYFGIDLYNINEVKIIQKYHKNVQF